MNSGKILAHDIYLQLKSKYNAYQFDDFVDVLQLEHCVIIFKKDTDAGLLKFMIEIATSPFKVYRREINLYTSDKVLPEILKDYKEYEDIVADARKLAKGKSIT